MWASKTPEASRPLGLVVGATKLDAVVAARTANAEAWLLAPGVGAQGASASDVVRAALAGAPEFGARLMQDPARVAGIVEKLRDACASLEKRAEASKRDAADNWDNLRATHAAHDAAVAEIAELRERLATATTATKTAPSADDEAKEIERERALAAADERLAQLEDLNAALEKEAAGAKALDSLGELSASDTQLVARLDALRRRLPAGGEPRLDAMGELAEVSTRRGSTPLPHGPCTCSCAADCML